MGVMGRQDLPDVTLIRHAYVDPGAQRQGAGSRLLTHLLEEIPGPVLVGTWAAAWWAIRFYEKHGFRLVTQVEKDRLAPHLLDHFPPPGGNLGGPGGPQVGKR